MPTSSTSTSTSLQNPPRKVRRLRELALKETSSSSNEFQLSSFPSASLPIVAASSPSPSAVPVPRRRGRKPAGPLSKTAREQLRKTNHSVIEKRRRERINEALAALRQLVPNDKAHDSEKKDKEDREFKLEILIRTVDYLRTMVDKMKNSEQGLCVKCGGDLASSHPTERGNTMPSPIEPERLPKRKRCEYEDEEDDSAYEEDGDDFDNEVISTQPSPSLPPQVLDAHVHVNTDSSSSNRIRLPSISTWLANAPPSPISQLPSPPQSVPFAPTAITTGFLPGLVLPPPIRFQSGSDPRPSSNSSSAIAIKQPHDIPASPDNLASSSSLGSKYSLFRPCSSPRHESIQQEVKGGDSRYSPAFLRNSSPHSHSNSSRPSSSSRWSRDEQTAATLLLNFSSRHSTSSSDDERQWQGEREEEDNNDLQWQAAPYSGPPRTVLLEAHTPSSMLGMPTGGP